MRARFIHDLMILAAASTAGIASARPPSPLDPLVVWGDSGSNEPMYATHDGIAWSTPAATRNVGAEARYVIVRPAPDGQQYAVGTLDMNGDVNLMFFDGTSWVSPTEVSGDAAGGQRTFDIAYEQSSGTAMIVYADTNEGNLGYRLFSGMAIAAEIDIAMPSGSAPEWVALYPRADDDTIMLILCQSDASLHAKTWNGSGWGAWSTISADTGGWSGPKRVFDLAYESASGHALIAYRSGSLVQPYYRTWNGGGWSAEAAIGTVADKPMHIRLRANPDITSDEILLGVKDAAFDINVGVWGGSTWSALQTVETDTVNHTSTKSFDIEFERNTGKGLIVYSEDLSTALRYRTWDGTSLSSEVVSTDVGSDKHNVQLLRGVHDGEILVALEDSSEHLNLVVWNGTSMSGSNEIDTSLTNTGSDGDLQMFMGAPSVTANMLLVVGSPSLTTGAEAARQAQFESWGYAVTLIGESESQANFDAAFDTNHVVYVSEEVSDAALGSKLADAPIGGVVEKNDYFDDLGLTRSVPATQSETDIVVLDYDHYITAPWEVGSLQICSGFQSMNGVGPVDARSGQTLAEWPGGGASLVTIDGGGRLSTGSKALGRRVFLPIGDDTFDWSMLTADGRQLVYRSIKWARGTVAHWELDETSGVTAADSVGGYDAALTGMDPASDWVSGRIDGALEFDGMDDRAQTTDAFPPPVEGTVAFWMKVPGSPTAHARILGLGDTWEVRHVTTGTPDGIPYGLVFDLGFQGLNAEFVTTVTIDEPDRWYFVAATYNTTSGAYAVYLDGVLHKSGTTSLVRTAANNLSLGVRTGTTDYFPGLLDDVRVMDVEMGADEVEALLHLRPPRVLSWSEVEMR